MHDFIGLSDVVIRKSTNPFGTCIYISYSDVSILTITRFHDHAKSIRRISSSHAYDVVFYGGLFALHRNSVLNSFDFITYFSSFKPRLTRLDYCIDFPITIDYASRFCIRKGAGGKHYGSDGKVETLNIGERAVSKNRFLFIRLYNKLAEARSNKKEFLYTDYFNDNDNVSRLEFEIRSQALRAHGFDYDDLFTPSLLSLVASLVSGRYHHIDIDLTGFRPLVRNISEEKVKSDGLAFFIPRIRSLFLKLRKLNHSDQDIYDAIKKDLYDYDEKLKDE